MRKRPTPSRGVCWIRAVAFTAATCGAANLSFAAEVDPSVSTLEANPFYQAGVRPLSGAPVAAASPTATNAPAANHATPVVASASAPAPGSASRSSHRSSVRRLPAMPKSTAATLESTIADSGRRLPPLLPATDLEVAALPPTLPLESPMPGSPSASVATIRNSATQAAPYPTNRFTLAQIERNRQDAKGPVRPQLGELDDYRLEVDDAQLGVVAEQARAQVLEGIGLAERGAFFSARSNFVNALRTIAQALDGDSQSPVHAEALAMGLDALQEADDFAVRGDARTAATDVATVASSHRTPALTTEQAATATPNDAMRAYYSFAAEALSRCGGSSATAAEALFQLGKLQSFLVEQDVTAATAAIPRSTALFHAALAISPRHARAGNELGFLLAKSGDYANARSMLQRAVASEPLAEAWHNLAIVHERLGETDLATQARDRFAAIAAVQGGTDAALGSQASPRVTWVAPETMKTPPAEAFPEPSASPTPDEAVRTARPESDGVGIRR